MTITGDMQAAIGKVPADAWTPAYDGDGGIRDGAWVADITGLLDLSSWPAGMRVIVRKERPHPGAQLRFTDIDGHRFTALATDTRKGQLADLELSLSLATRNADVAVGWREAISSAARSEDPGPMTISIEPWVKREIRSNAGGRR
jgi:hypothetical protein